MRRLAPPRLVEEVVREIPSRVGGPVPGSCRAERPTPRAARAVVARLDLTAGLACVWCDTTRTALSHACRLSVS